MKEAEKIAFYGISGSGKTTAINYLEKEQGRILPGYEVIVLNVGEPLHKIQAYSYSLFGMENRGQDGLLLQFLARHFEKRLGPAYLQRLEAVLKTEREKTALIVNGDVRNNAYHFLKSAGFVFIRVLAAPEEIKKRLKLRGDISRFNTSDAVEWIDEIKADYVLKNFGTMDVYKKDIADLIEKVIANSTS